MLKMHMRTHEQRPPKQPTCSVCQRTFPTKTLLYRHRQTHFEQKTHQCTVCDKRFFSGYALRSHMARHRGERPYVCSNCNKSFYNPTDLKVSCYLTTGIRDPSYLYLRVAGAMQNITGNVVSGPPFLGNTIIRGLPNNRITSRRKLVTTGLPHNTGPLLIPTLIF